VQGDDLYFKFDMMGGKLNYVTIPSIFLTFINSYYFSLMNDNTHITLFDYVLLVVCFLVIIIIIIIHIIYTYHF
jgi:hypothetical protein